MNARRWMMVIAVALTGCSKPSLEGTLWRCESQADCTEGYVCSTGLGACVVPDNSADGVYADRIVVGMSAPLANGDTTAGRAVREGMEAYFGYVNANGGLDGRQVEVRALDDGGNPNMALSNVQTMSGSGEVFAFLGNVGTDTAQVVAPYLVENKRLLLGAVSGSSALRKDPPDRYVFNFRPSFEQEAAQGVGYLVSVRDFPVPVDNVAVFAEGEDASGVPDAYGQEGVTAVKDALRAQGGNPANLVVATHTRNTSDVTPAVGAMLKWLSSGRSPNDNGSISASIVLVSTARPAAAFVKALLEELAKIQAGDSGGQAFQLTTDEATRLFSVTDLTFFAISSVGVDQMSRELASFGNYQTVAGMKSFCESVLASQVVPSLDSNASGLITYREHLHAMDPNLVPSALSLEGYLVARIFSAAVIKHGPALSTEGVVDALEQLSALDFGVGTTLGFSPSAHQASDKVFGTTVSPLCALEPLDLGEPTGNPPPTGDGCENGVCTLTGVITQDKTLTADKRWLLKGTVFVGDGASRTVLTVEPGTTVLGDKATTGVLVIRRGSQIQAVGSREMPIVFTSAQPVGMRRSGDWGGLIINGRAPINQCGLEASQCTQYNQAFGEGGTGFFGGNDPNDDSGELRYVRIEFAGKLLSPENELNGLALQGVGRGTTLDYIQVHRGRDDAVEFFGGTVDAKHLLLTGAEDDSLDWTWGWQGRGQFIITQHWRGDADNGIEADNNAEDRNAQPRAHPVLSNLTLVGVPTSTTSDYGMLLREGTGADILNSVVLGFEDACINIDHAETWANAMMNSGSSTVASGGLVIRNTVISCATNFEESADDPVTVQAFVMSMNQGNQVVQDVNSILEGALDTVSPDMRPKAGGPAISGAEVPTDPFFEQVTYKGAVDPAGSWTLGWTTNVVN
ncbi:MAG: ABC transporter substrate-binding protein [Myxococcales bacterium]|nr:ABC transporter substrate-binding protein [Myxococcales bacterium]